MGPDQTVPRAETTAVLKALQLTDGSIELATDADYMIPGFNKLPRSRGLDCSNPDLWAEIRDVSDGRPFALQRVKAHLWRERFATLFPDRPIWSWIGNQAADSRAQNHANSRQSDVPSQSLSRLLSLLGHPEWFPTLRYHYICRFHAC